MTRAIGTVKSEVKKAPLPLPLPCPLAPGPLPHSEVTFHYPPLAAEQPIETSLIGFHVPCQIKLQMDFSFPNHIPAYSVSPYSLQVLYPCFQLLQASFFIAEFCWQLLFHPSRPPAISLNFLLLEIVDS